MFNLLYIEWLKVRKYRTFWVLAGLFATLLVLWNYMVSNGFVMLGVSNINVLNTSYSFPAVWAMLLSGQRCSLACWLLLSLSW